MSLPASHKRTIKFGNENLMALLAFIKNRGVACLPPAAARLLVLLVLFLG